MQHSFLDWDLHHIGVVVRDMEKARLLYIQLGYQCSETICDLLQNVFLAFCESKKGPAVELVAPVDETSPCTPFLNKIGPGTYHTCYSCSSIQMSLSILDQLGLRYFIVSEPKPARLFNDQKVIFLLFASTGLIELIERIE